MKRFERWASFVVTRWSEKMKLARLIFMPLPVGS